MYIIPDVTFLSLFVSSSWLLFLLLFFIIIIIIYYYYYYFACKNKAKAFLLLQKTSTDKFLLTKSEPKIVFGLRNQTNHMLF